MAFRFVHAADIHLDSPLKSLALRDAELAELIGNATRRAFVGIIELCLVEQVDALLLAGDLYDGDQTSMKTARFLADQVKLLHDAGIRVFVIRGNHDALSRITNELVLPDTVKLFGGRADAVQIVSATGEVPVAIHGMSFTRPHAPESLLPKYRPPLEGSVNIALMHTSLDGSMGHDPYAPCKITDLQGAGYQYWGLGHIHKRAEVKGQSLVVMPGMPQGRDINEAGAKSVSLVTVRDDRSIQVEERLTSIAQFERVRLDLTGVETWTDMVRNLEKTLQDKRREVPSEHLVVRLRVTGATPLAWQIRRDFDLLRTEAAHRAFDTGRSWIEKVEIDCRAPESIGDCGGVDPLAELRRLIGADISESAEFRTEAAEIAEELRAQLPPELRAILGSDQQQFEHAIDDLRRQGAEDVLARLQAKAEPDEA